MSFNSSLGVYLLDVLSEYEVFPQLKIKVNAETGSIRLAEYKYLGGKRLPASYPVVLNAITEISYYDERPPFSIMSFIWGNPMIIMLIFSTLLVFVFPAMMSQMTEEELAELEKSNEGIPTNPMEAFKKLMGGGADQSAIDD